MRKWGDTGRRHFVEWREVLLNKLLNRFRIYGFESLTEEINVKYTLCTHGLLAVDGAGIFGRFEPSGLPTRKGEIQTGFIYYPDGTQSPELKTGEGCILVPLTPLDAVFRMGPDKCIRTGRGYNTIINRYASLLADLDTTLESAAQNERALAFLSSPDDLVVEKMRQARKGLEDGETVIIMEDSVLDRIQINPMRSDLNSFKNITEMHNFLISCFWQEIGVNAPISALKRERVQGAEIENSGQISDHNFYEDLERVEEYLQEVNRVHGTAYTVEEVEPEEEPQEEPEEPQEDPEEPQEKPEEVENNGG